MNELFIREVEMPTAKVKAFTKEDSEGDYNVYINQYLSDEAKHKSLIHELLHIKNHHFSCGDVIICENQLK